MKKQLFVSITLLVCMLALISACARRRETTAASYMDSGRRYFEKKDYVRAILEYRNASRLAPHDAEPLYRMGLAYYASGNIERSADAFRKAAQADPNHAASQLKLAQLMAGSDDPAAVEEALHRLTTLLETSESPETLNTLAFTDLRLGNEVDAVRYLNRALERFPKELDAYVGLARVKIAKRDLAGAEAIFKRAVAAAPKSGEPVLALARFYAYKRDLPAAEAQLQKLLQMDPLNSPALLDRSLLSFETGRKTEAEEGFRKLSLAADPLYWPAYGVYLSETGRHPEAVTEFERLYRLNPSDHATRARLIASYQVLGRTAEAENLLTVILKKSPKDFDALLERAEVYISSGRYDQALLDLNTLLRFRRESAEVHYIVAQFHRLRGASLSYRQELSESVRLAPSLLKARLELARFLTANKGGNSALQILNEAPPPQNRYIDVLVEKNWALLQMGDVPEARKNIALGLSVQRNAELLLQQAVVKVNDHNLEAAKTDFQEVLKRAPTEVRALDGLSRVYTSQKQTQAMGALLESYAAAQPRSAAVQKYVGQWMSNHSRKDAARRYLQAAQKADPKSSDTALALAQLDIADGNLQKARQTLEGWQQTNGQDLDFLLHSASLSWSERQYPTALAQYEKVLSVDGNNLVALNNMAYLLASSLDRADDAIAYAQRAKEVAPSEPAVDDTLGWAYYNKGLFGEAVKYFQAAANASPDPAIQYHLGLAYLKQGDHRGYKVLEAALQAAPNAAEAGVARQALSGSR